MRKNITFSAKAEAIDKAREFAVQRHCTLNDLFRRWLDDLIRQATDNENIAEKLAGLWKQTGYLRVGKNRSRGRMRERR